MNSAGRHTGSHAPAGEGRRAPSRQGYRRCPSIELRVNVLSMRIRARIVLFASLACLLPQLTGPARASTPEADAVRVSAPVHHKARLAAEGVRASLPDGVLDRLLTAPFAPAALANLDLSAVNMAAPAFGHAEASANALLSLPRSRAPPALS